MAVQTTRRLAWVSVALVLVVAKPSQTQRCSFEEVDDTTIDIPAAFSKGIRGTDPIYTPSWNACVENCCSERIAGDKRCNYAIFNTKMKGSSPNCYHFYFPAQETCPVKPALGLITYRIIEGKELFKPAPSLNKVPHSIVNGSLASPQAAEFGLARPLGGPDSLAKTSTKEEIFGPSDHSFEEVDGSPQHPKAGRTNGVETLGSSIGHESNSAASTIQQSTPVKLSLATLDSLTSRTVGDAAAIHNPPSHTTTASPYAGKTEAATLQPSEGPVSKPLLPSETDPRGFSSLSSAPSTPTASLRGSHLSDGRLSLEGFTPDDNPAGNDFSLLTDQSILLAALFFGVLFFFLAVVLIGGKICCSRQPQRYTRLDYLINDMYANM
ncbi:MANSC domain-containing protein 1 [Pseudonaja textilis]|uniref:MANSC domain-containing protein 1 n=1 Tax=Pseudonaja textilis TaxID=8673 RepID=UPI000EA90132|nr:MANSC domain-containing protein 1 [Pseudonaja textilis]